MASPGEWYNSLPPVCRTWGTACVLTTVGVQLGVIDLRSIYPDYPLVFKRFQIWRLLTNFCFLGGFSFPFVMRVMMMCVACATARARSPELARAPPASRPRESPDVNNRTRVPSRPPVRDADLFPFPAALDTVSSSSSTPSPAESPISCG